MNTNPNPFDDFKDRWPLLYGHMHFDCKEGWRALLEELSNKLYEVIPKDLESDLYPIVCQVKEKYGSLRFYVNWGSNAMFDLIHDAEDKSTTICETCGATGSLDKRYFWVKTLCEQHTKERQNATPNI